MAGPEYMRVGGHTSCITLAIGDALPTLVLDAGTGLRRLTDEFGETPFRGTILLTHLHWDHLHGMPFFAAADREGSSVLVALPAQGDPVATLARSMSPPHFPIGPDGLQGSWTFTGLEPGRHRFGDYEVVAADVDHKGGRTFGYRVEAGGASCCYLPDASDDNDDAIVALAAGVDLFVRGAPFLTSESRWAVEYGHGTIEHTQEVARRAEVGRLVITHHGPSRTDADLDAIGRRLGVELAREGQTVDLGHCT